MLAIECFRVYYVTLGEFRAFDCVLFLCVSVWTCVLNDHRIKIALSVSFRFSFLVRLHRFFQSFNQLDEFIDTKSDSSVHNRSGSRCVMRCVLLFLFFVYLFLVLSVCSVIYARAVSPVARSMALNGRWKKGKKKNESSHWRNNSVKRAHTHQKNKIWIKRLSRVAATLFSDHEYSIDFSLGLNFRLLFFRSFLLFSLLFFASEIDSGENVADSEIVVLCKYAVQITKIENLQSLRLRGHFAISDERFASGISSRSQVKALQMMRCEHKQNWTTTTTITN